jgi:hypothetical protein
MSDNPDAKIPDFNIAPKKTTDRNRGELLGGKGEGTRRKEEEGEAPHLPNKKPPYRKSSLSFQQTLARRGEEEAWANTKNTELKVPPPKRSSQVRTGKEKNPDSQKREWVQHKTKRKKPKTTSSKVSSSTISQVWTTTPPKINFK